MTRARATRSCLPIMRWAVTFLTLTCATLACAPSRPSQHAPDLGAIRQSATLSVDGKTVARWLLGELFATGGSPEYARRARARLEKVGGRDLWSALARATDDELHGQLEAASVGYLETLKAAHTSDDPDTPMVAWVAAIRLLQLPSNFAAQHWPTWAGFVEQATEHPGKLGWRAAEALRDWREANEPPVASAGAAGVLARQRGCLSGLRLVGPFGTPHSVHRVQGFAPETPGPWPAVWPKDADSGLFPSEQTSAVDGCWVKAPLGAAPGVYYAETQVDTEGPDRVVISSPEALKLWVNDRLVLDRDVRTWGALGRVGVALELPTGSYRIVVKLAQPEVSLRIFDARGAPRGWQGQPKASSHGTSLPQIEPETDPLMRWLTPTGPRPFEDDIRRVFLAQLAHAEGIDDVAHVLLDPLLTTRAQTTGPTLSLAARVATGDPMLTETVSSDLRKTRQEAAVRKDPQLWRDHLELIITRGNAEGWAAHAQSLEALSAQFPEVPQLLATLAKVYGELGWNAEKQRTQLRLAQRFPQSSEAVYGAIEAHEAVGNFAAADELLEQLARLDPESSVPLSRALERRDYAGAQRALARLEALGPKLEAVQQSKQQLTRRMAAPVPESQPLAAMTSDPGDWIEHGDRELAAGDQEALARAFVGARVAGVETLASLSTARDVLAGSTEFEPFRVDARDAIAAFEAQGQRLAGTAARVLDYAVLWIKSDGSSRMLEHEIIRIQSEEAIAKIAEHPRLEGLVLNMRVLKADGRALEPEVIAGKPSVTLPHLEVGDYVETEQLLTLPAQAAGLVHAGQRWYFQEESVGYARSEFVVLSPTGGPLQIETSGSVPALELEQRGPFLLRRWRANFSPPASVEPMSPPVREFLPSVRVGWGLTLERRLGELGQRVAKTTPVDPRIISFARELTSGIAEADKHARAARLHRWVLETVRSADEADGRRAISSKQGNRWQALKTLLDASEIPSHYVLTKTRLSPPALGPFSEAEQFSLLLLRVVTERGPEFVTAEDEYLPFGYVPAEARGMPGFALEATGPNELVVPDDPGQDIVRLDGVVQLDASGRAELELTHAFEGQFAARMRRGLASVTKQRLHDLLETEVLQQNLAGASLDDYSIEHQKDYEQPLLVRMSGSAARFARKTSRSLLIEPPFTPNLSQLATLPSRATPLLIGQTLHRTLSLKIALPAGAKVVLPKSVTLTGPRFEVHVRDRLESGKLVLEREVRLRPGRVAPEHYGQFARQLRQAHHALISEVEILL